VAPTPNPPSVVDAEGFTVRRTIEIAAPREKVWAAVTEPEHIAGWFSDTATLAALETGAEGVLHWHDHGDFPFRVEAVDPPYSVAYRWGNELAHGRPSEAWDAQGSTVFTFTLEEIPSGTRLTVVETGFDAYGDPVAAMEDNRGGWDYELDELVAYVEAAA